MASDFAATPSKAWDRLVELVVYSPGDVDSSAIYEQGGAQFGLVVSGLDMEFKVTKSQVYAENTAEFKIYNASMTTRKQLGTKGLRVRFSAGYAQQGGLAGVFWGSVVRGPSSRVGNDWVTTMNCISSLTEATGTLDIAQAGKQKNNKTAGTRALTPEQKQDLINQAVNRIPIRAGYGPDVPVKLILQDLAKQTGLVLWGAEGMDPITLDNGWVYAGGIRGALQNLRQILHRWGWNLYTDSTSIILVPMDGFGVSTYSVAFLSYDTGLKSVHETTPMNVPPKLDGSGKRVIIPPTYEFNCLLSPKIDVNQQVLLKTPEVNALSLVYDVTHEGDNFGGPFDTKGKCVTWSGPGDTLRKVQR